MWRSVNNLARELCMYVLEWRKSVREVCLTLYGTAGGLGQAYVLLGDVVDRLVLRDLHAGAHVTLTMQEEGEGAREVLTAAEETHKKIPPHRRMSLHVLAHSCIQKRAISTK